MRSHRLRDKREVLLGILATREARNELLATVAYYTFGAGGVFFLLVGIISGSEVLKLAGDATWAVIAAIYYMADRSKIWLFLMVAFSLCSIGEILRILF